MVFVSELSKYAFVLNSSLVPIKSWSSLFSWLISKRSSSQTRFWDNPIGWFDGLWQLVCPPDCLSCSGIWGFWTMMLWARLNSLRRSRHCLGLRIMSPSITKGDNFHLQQIFFTFPSCLVISFPLDFPKWASLILSISKVNDQRLLKSFTLSVSLKASKFSTSKTSGWVVEKSSLSLDN